MFGLLLLTGCADAPPLKKPSVAFTKVPPYGAGSASKLVGIEGSATELRGGEQVVIYARSGDWWVQPFAAHPFTPVIQDGTWHSRTHPGSAYAAILVRPGFHPLTRIDSLPRVEGPVLAAVSVEDPNPERLTGKAILFDGYEWKVRDTPNEPGGTPNDYDPANAWTDKAGFMHLRISGQPGHWKSAEVSLRRSLGYGTYRFVVRDLSKLEPAAVFTMMTWSDSATAHSMDIEISKWGETSAKSGQFVIQPYFVPANTVQFDVPEGPTTFLMRWSAGRAAFRAYRGVTPQWDAKAVREHVFTLGVPSPAGETVHMNLYVFDRNNNPLKRGAEVVVEAFEYLP